MSEILIGSNPNNPEVIGIFQKNPEPEVEQISMEDKAKQLPTPMGYRILCAIPEVEDTFENGLAKPDSMMRTDELLTTVLFVVKMGSDCYEDQTRFPTGAWCKEGDFVLVRPNAGTRLVIHGREFRIINDDSIEAVVQDPRGITRKFL